MPIGPIEDDDKLYAANQYLLRIIEVLQGLGGGGGGGGLATEAKQDDQITELLGIASSLSSILSELQSQSGNQLQTNFTRVNVAGTIPAGKVGIIISVIGNNDYIVDGTLIPNEKSTIGVTTNNDLNTLGALTYDPNGGELLIITQELP